MEQMALDLWPKAHASCRGCFHLERSYRPEGTHSTREVCEFGCDLSNWGYRPKGSPRYARGCPDGLPEMWETAHEHNLRTDFGSLHPITLRPIGVVR